MTRTEFDNQVREMKAKRAEALRPVMDMQRELREKIAAKNRTIAEMGAEVKKMKHQLSLLSAQNTRINDEHNAKIKAFIDEYESHTTSNLAEAGILNIIYELRHRGFSGVVHDTIHGGDYNLQKTDWNHD
jgi:seryl-tRNA synthetase